MSACVAMSNSVAITVNFSEPNYVIGENNGQVEPKLILSNPSSTDIIIRVDTIDIEAIGEYNCDVSYCCFLLYVPDRSAHNKWQALRSM